jgi:site-specific DNA-cytosine methylase
VVTGGFFDNLKGFHNTGKGWWNEGDIAGTVRTPKGTDSINHTVISFSNVSDGSSARNASDISNPLTCRHGDPGMIAFRTNQTSANGPIHSVDVTDSLASDHPPAAVQGMQVRRLTPVECSRLQGVPDDHLDILHNGKPLADGNKYRLLGNGFAVPVVAWIGRRIQMVEDMTK